MKGKFSCTHKRASAALFVDIASVLAGDLAAGAVGLVQ